MRVLGIIPARKNSKSIAGKNVAMLCGKPLIQYTLEAAKDSILSLPHNRIVVSTDCLQVSALAESFGIEVIERPESLAKDDTPMVPVLQHASRVAGEPFDAVMLLQPTCPMRRGEDIDGAWAEMLPGVSSVISYVDVGANHPARMATIESGYPFPVWHSLRWANKQDLPKFYLRSGDIYLTRMEWIERGDLVGDKPRAYVMPADRWCNIDSPRDLEWAEFLMSREHNLVGVG